MRSPMLFQPQFSICVRHYVNAKMMSMFMNTAPKGNMAQCLEADAPRVYTSEDSAIVLAMAEVVIEYNSHSHNILVDSPIRGAVVVARRRGRGKEAYSLVLL